MGPHRLDPVRERSYEGYFLSAGASPFLLDLRGSFAGADSTSWLLGPRDARAIGCCYEPGQPAQYWFAASLPALYDLVIHVDRTGPTTVLPYRPPTAF